MNIQHMVRDDDHDKTVCGDPQENIPLGEVVHQCQTCLAIYQGHIPDPASVGPVVVVPDGFAGSAAEAIALAVAGAIQAIADERDNFQGCALTLYEALAELTKVYPRTSFAGPESALERALEALRLSAGHLGLEPEKEG